MNFDRKQYWERKILPWERARYGGLAWARPGSWTLRRRMRQAVRIAKEALPPGGSVLELGCGSGLFARQLTGTFGTYHGIDLAEAAVLEARALAGGPRAEFVQGDVLEACLPASDLAVFLGLLDWLEPGEASRLIARIPARRLLFSFTEESASASGLSPYGLYRAWYDTRFGAGIYRARAWRATVVREWLQALGPHKATFFPSNFLDPGRLVLVERDA